MSMYHDPDYYSVPELPDDWDSAVLPIDKPTGITSFDVIRKLRRITGQRKIGHAGTLDPMATGLLICLLGRSTKKMREFLEMPKRYTGKFRLGQTTASYDADTPVEHTISASHLSVNQIRSASEAFVGEIRQHTPMYSAVKHEGERLYKKARRGEKVIRPTRDVSVYAFEVLDLIDRDVEFDISCSKGTYIRSIAHELGQKIGVGAHLIELRRTEIGPIKVDNAWQLDTLALNSQGISNQPTSSQ